MGISTGIYNSLTRKENVVVVVIVVVEEMTKHFISLLLQGRHKALRFCGGVGKGTVIH